MQWGVRLVTPEFAQAAIASLDARYAPSVLTEAVFEEFYDHHCRGHMPEHTVDSNQLSALKLELDLRTALGDDTTELLARIRRALDPDDAEPGVKRDLSRHWADYKTCQGITCDGDGGDAGPHH